MKRLTCLWALLLLRPLAAAPDQPAAVLQDQLSELIARVSKAYVNVGGGAGAVISPDGWVLTNFHVVKERLQERWHIEVGGGRAFHATVVGYDSDDAGDIALLKLDGAKDLPHLELSPSDDLVVGQWVLSFGDPYSVAPEGVPSVSLGTVSALHLPFMYRDGVQTDASINPGNSGGPLVDLRGRLVGITGKHQPRFGVRASTGNNYAVGASRVLRLLERLKAGGATPRCRIDGLFLGQVLPNGAVQISNVTPGSPADAAGLKAGDAMVRMAGVCVGSVDGVKARMSAFLPGERIILDVLRGGAARRVPIILDAVSVDKPTDAQILAGVSRLMGGHQHVPHPDTGQTLHLDFVRTGTEAAWEGSDTARVKVAYKDRISGAACELSVKVRQEADGQLRVIQKTVLSLGEKIFGAPAKP